MKKNPLVSILMPVYNAEQFLAEAIESILNQSYTNFELLVFNDGSTDNSLSIIDSFTDKRIKLYNNKINCGHVVQLNKGIQLAEGEYIARMDADDVALQNRLEQQVRFLENNKDIAILGSQVELVDGELNHIHYKELPMQPEELACYHLFFCPFIHPSVMIRAEVYKQFEYKPEYLMAEDYHLWVKMLSKFKGSNLPDCLLKYRIHSNNYGSSNKAKSKRLLKNIYRELLEQWGIPFTESDLTTHLKITHSNQSIINAEDVSLIEKWLLKIKKHLPPEINNDVFSKVIEGVWKEILWKVDKSKFSSYWNYISSNSAAGYTFRRKLGIIKEFSFPMAKLIAKVV